MNLLIAGALIHDSGKIREYEWKTCPVRMSEAGLLGNHMVFGPMQSAIAMEVARDELLALGFTDRDLLLLQHVQMSHHGTKEMGAVKEPRCPEALLVHHADLSSAHTHAMLAALRKGLEVRDGWVSAGWPYRELARTVADEPVASDLDIPADVAPGNDQTELPISDGTPLQVRVAMRLEAADTTAEDAEHRPTVPAPRVL
jgi:hypothetical protein